MKKWVAYFCMAFLLFGLAGCTEVPDKTAGAPATEEMTFDIGPAREVCIKSGISDDEVTITDEEFIQEITENMNSLRFEKASATEGAAGFVYRLTWLDAAEKQIATVTITDEEGRQISAEGGYYSTDPGLSIRMDLIAARYNQAFSSPASTDTANIGIAYADGMPLADALDEFMDYPSEYQVKVVFTTDIPVKDFRFLSLTWVDMDESGMMEFETEDLYTWEELSPQRPLVVGMTFVGSIPDRGIAYVDADGTTKYYSIGMSGQGSDEEAEPLVLLEILPAACEQ